MLFLLSRRYRVAVFLSALVMFSVSQFSMAALDFSKVVGSAYSVKTGELLYRETHQSLSPMEHTVEYSEPDGQVFGHKKIDWSRSLITPDFSQINGRNGEQIVVEQVGDQFKIEYQENLKSKWVTGTEDLVPGMVVDAGFDGFIKKYWAALDSNTQMDIEYLVPTQQATFSFYVKKTVCLDGTVQGATCFALIPASWVVRLAVDPITVAYDSNTHQLLRFTGRANICDIKGKYQNVDILYHYL
ncbi:hypothetical protein [Marinomonas transparens]|uniref:Uncharacterized protein n=1 Tax=Marinomonas transparens TaxID=2795388 RepID=A0A934JVY8_9GAMM|nr:hypothetical protein [Marinomonas transparens]MBJ7538017.1 hypothetical protein [Marinomonas transparens]